MRSIFIEACLLVLLFNVLNGVISDADYYWKDWNGTAPEDAFIAGTNNGETIYAVQAEVVNYGTFITFAKENQTIVTVAAQLDGRYPPLSITKASKVLCTQGEPFEWVYMNIDELEPVMETYAFFVAGNSTTVNMNPDVHVGRFNVSGNTYVGSIYWSYWLYYSNGTMSLNSMDYEMLVMHS